MVRRFVRYRVRLRKRTTTNGNNWMVHDTTKDEPTRGPFKTKAAAEYVAKRLNEKTASE